VPVTLEPLSPQWWIARLYKQLVDRRDMVDFFSNYYCGDHPLPWLAPQARGEFRRILGMTRSNYMGLVCDATAERLRVEGFRFGNDASADKDTWRLWQINNLDSDSDMAWLEALICGVSYFHVAPNPADAEAPHIWVEHASQAIVEHQPGTNRRVRAASLKVWDDDWTQEIHATLQLPTGIYKFKAPRPKSGNMPKSPAWVEREVIGEQPNGQRPNPLGVVSMVEIPNNPRLLTGGISELYDVTDIQDRINKTLADRIITQDYGAFPQKWIAGWPDEDDDGKPNTVDIGRNRAVTTDVSKTDVEFGQWESAPLDPYSAAKREDVKDIASRTRTPAQYLLGEMSNVNGETLKASESGLISKTRQRQRPFSEAAEETMRIARKAAGMASPGEARMETLWVDPQYRTEGERTDAIVKRLQTRIASLRQAREDYGYTATEIERLEQDDADEAAQAAGAGVKAIRDAAAGGN
jgi:hypothetical protein